MKKTVKRIHQLKNNTDSTLCQVHNPQWEDTLLTPEQMQQVIYSIPPRAPGEDYSRLMEATCQAQAEVSFKAGIKEVVDWLKIQLGSREGTGSRVSDRDTDGSRRMIPEILTWRTECWKNPYGETLALSPDKQTQYLLDNIFEAGATAMLEALFKMAKESPTGTFTIDSKEVTV